MKIELSEEDVKVAVAGYLHVKLGIAAQTSDITLDGYSSRKTAIWEKELDTDED